MSCSGNTPSGDEEVRISLGEVVGRHNDIGLALLHLRGIEIATNVSCNGQKNGACKPS